MSSESIEHELEEEFSDVGIDIEGNLVILEKLRSMCVSYQLSASDLVAKWFTFSALKNDCDLTLNIIEDFSKSVAQNASNTRKGKRQSSQSSQPVIYDMNTLESQMQEQEEEEDMLLGYAKTPQSKGTGKRLHTTPEQVTNKKIANIIRTPRTFSPASFSPSTEVASSPKYEGRNNKGDIVASYPQSIGMKWKGSRNNLKIKPYNEKANLKEPYKYMFEKLTDRADVLDGIIESLSEAMATAFNLEDFKRISYVGQEEFTCMGRICCDALGKLNAKSMLLEGSKELSNGERVKLDVSEIPNFSFFPGQIITAKGIKTGSKVIVKEMHDGVRLPFHSTANKDCSVNEDDFVVYIACGPFVTSDTLSHAPLLDFLNIIEAEKPDLLIMLGPFVDSKIPSIENAEVDFSFDDKFKEYENKIMTAALSAGSKVIFVPSQRDVHHHYIYPQPPFEIYTTNEKIKEKILAVSDPATVFVNDVVFGITSTDILFHLGSEEAFCFAPGSSDRLGRLCGHLLKQQSYYPLQPPSEEINIDYLNFEKYCLMQTTPDILLLPSDLRFFVKDVDGCLCINPGRLVKGQTGGTFAKLHVKPSKMTNGDKSLALSKSIAQIVKL